MLLRYRLNDTRPMSFSEYKYLICSDLYRITRRVSVGTLIRYILLSSESYRYNFWLRTCRYAKTTVLLKVFLFPVAKLMHRRLTYKLGISIPECTDIGSGLYICHFGGIVINGSAVLGKNCNISQGVTLGQANRGRNKGYPKLGDGVYLGPGAKVVGAVTIGNNVAIGANCVVTTNIADNSVVIGVPGRVISRDGAAAYVNNTDYDANGSR
jgi:serine O-acetyltransferase